MKIDLLGDFELGEFKPRQVIIERLGLTQYLYEDVSHFASPVVPGIGHSVDWLIAHDRSRIVGIQFWTVHPTLSGDT